MGKITSIKELKVPNFVKPVEINYTQNGVAKKWEAVLSHDSVAILLYHTQKDAFVLVKQLRATVLNKNQNNGYMYELCAGIVDKECSNAQIAKEEILEECGYDVPVQNLEKISAFYTSVGISGTHQTLYYAEIDESMKVNDGGGLEEEEIEVIYIPLSEAKKFMFDESYQKTTGVSLAFYWFFDTKKGQH
ncbi:NUDIX domain-containing protein [Sulfurimonas sp. SWIR-19]|uniref:NUDIX domain-containing protein n=1 Tax=Sulfurimonas sp. SWIR-19 TaxID=2878390 RepID=UPI001CF1A405|nr:NUDIX domain-containing protein [Sulfurimonas sp. SWIR-19]UCN00667.1 NUDIX domain-containing protein [Sulfurimonas sp. SWIR-19]